MILGFIGYAGSGKDTAYKFIREHFPNCARLAFADILKDVADDMLEIATFERVANTDDRDIKNDIRPLLVWLGEYARKQNLNYWIDKIKPNLDYLLNAKCPLVVFTDVRYLNEAEWVTSMGGKLIYILAGKQPANETEAKSIQEILENTDHYTVVNHFTKEQFTSALLAVLARIGVGHE